MPKVLHSKRYRADVKKYEPLKAVGVKEAVATLRTFSKAKFDETVNLNINLNIDPKKQDQNLRGAVSLPHGTGNTARVICFAEGDAATKAKEAGAIAVGAADLVKKIEEGFTDFDVAIATPDMMRHVGKLGKILGPLGKMPAPKAGTVTTDVTTAVREFAAGKIEFRTDPAGTVHTVVGKRSFSDEKLMGNIEFMINHIKALRPSSVKGEFIKKAVISGTMTPGVPLTVTV